MQSATGVYKRPANSVVLVGVGECIIEVITEKVIVD